jgi:hypothetical protein
MDQTFDEWLNSEHRHTFIHLRLREIDEKPVDYTNAHGLVANEAVRRELRLLESWRPSFPEKVEEQKRTNYKAGEYRRGQLERQQ